MWCVRAWSVDPPVDCAEYNPNQLLYKNFVYYAISIPSLEIAVASTFGVPN